MSRSARCALMVPIVLLALAACSTPSPAPAPARPAPAEALTPDEVEFVAQARKIAPKLVGDDERIAARGKNTCTSLADGRPTADAVKQAVERFSSGSYSVTTAEASELVEAARSTVCKF